MTYTILNMVEARVPDELRNWNAMDIFIFSNGQQYSPPRKYHLCSDDLKFWESTISFLAHSQYGSIHSRIDLYTIGGIKVDGPLELSNDAAYVAVKPPDPFIQSGYDKYLLKASRSWEKRQGKILGGMMDPMHEKIHLSGSLELTTSPNKPDRADSVSTTETGKSSKISSATKHKPFSTQPQKISSKPSTRTTSLSKDPIERRKLLTTKAILRRGKLSDTSSQNSSIIKNLGVVDKTVLKQGLTPKETPIIDAILETESSASAKKLTNDTKLAVDNGLSVIMENYEPNNKQPDIESPLLPVADKDANTEAFDDNEKKPENAVTNEIGTQYNCDPINERWQKDCTVNLNLNIELRASPENNIALKKCFSIESIREDPNPVESKHADDAKAVLLRCKCSSQRDDLFAFANDRAFILVPQGLNAESSRVASKIEGSPNTRDDEKMYINGPIQTGTEEMEKVIHNEQITRTKEKMEDNNRNTDNRDDRVSMSGGPDKEISAKSDADKNICDYPQNESTQTEWYDVLLSVNSCDPRSLKREKRKKDKRDDHSSY